MTFHLQIQFNNDTCSEMLCCPLCLPSFKLLCSVFKHCIKDFTGQVSENISELQTLYCPKMLLQSSGKHLVAAPETRSKLLI